MWERNSLCSPPPKLVVCLYSTRWKSITQLAMQPLVPPPLPPPHFRHTSSYTFPDEELRVP